MVRVQRVELWFQPWEGYVLPLYDTRILESKVLEPPRRFELRTPALRKRCSSQLSQGGTPCYIIPCELQKPRGFATIRLEFCACSEAGPSRLPVTEEIAGSNPVERATMIRPLHKGHFLFILIKYRAGQTADAVFYVHYFQLVIWI